MKKFENDSGLTVKQLNDLIKDLPEKNKDGEDCEVWIGTLDNLSNVAKSVWPLNGDSGDIIINPK